MAKRSVNGKNQRQNADRRRYSGSRQGKTSRTEIEKDTRQSSTKSDKRTISRSPNNDISWYSRYPNLLLGAGQFPYPNKPGSLVNFGSMQMFANAAAESGIALETQMAVPGIAVLDWYPSVGYSNSSLDPASVVCKELYARVRQAYSSDLDVDGPDILVYLMSLDSVFAYIAWLKRIYRACTAWSPENYVLPDAVFRACNISAADQSYLLQHRMRLWNEINTLVLQTRQFKCPAVMDIFNRHYWLSDNIYTDANSLNSQLYMFNPAGLYFYEARNVPDVTPVIQASGLNLTPMPYFGYSREANEDAVSYLIRYGRSMLQDLIDWAECYTINGYLQRAFVDTPSFMVDELGAGEALMPVYSEEVLTQIENSFAVSGITRSMISGTSNPLRVGMHVAQNPATNTVVSLPAYTYGSTTAGFFALSNFNHWLSIRSDVPTVADSVIASRLKYGIRSESRATGAGITVELDCGTEMPLCWSLVFKQGDASDYSVEPLHQMPTATTAPNASTSNRAAFMLAQFDWAPFYFLYGKGTPAAPQSQPLLVGDIHNLTTVTQQDMLNLHRVCLYSEFNSFQI